MGNCCTTDTTVPDDILNRNTEESRSVDQLQQPLMKGTGGEVAEVTPNRSNSHSVSTSSTKKKKKKKKHKKGGVELQIPTINEHILQMTPEELASVWSKIDVDHVQEININAELEKLFGALIEHYIREQTRKSSLESKYNHRVRLLSKDLCEQFLVTLQNYQYQGGDSMTKHFFLNHFQPYIATPHPVFTLIPAEQMRPRDSYVVIESGDDQDPMPVIPPSRSEQEQRDHLQQHHEINTIFEVRDPEEQSGVPLGVADKEKAQRSEHQVAFMNVPSEDSMKAERCASPMASESSKYVQEHDDETDTLTITTNPEERVHPGDHYDHGAMVPATSEQSQITNLTGVTRGTSTLTVHSAMTASVGGHAVSGVSATSVPSVPSVPSSGAMTGRESHNQDLSMYVNVGSTVGQPDALESVSPKSPGLHHEDEDGDGDGDGNGAGNGDGDGDDDQDGDDRNPKSSQSVESVEAVVAVDTVDAPGPNGDDAAVSASKVVVAMDDGNTMDEAVPLTEDKGHDTVDNEQDDGADPVTVDEQKEALNGDTHSNACPAADELEQENVGTVHEQNANANPEVDSPDVHATESVKEEVTVTEVDPDEVEAVDAVMSDHGNVDDQHRDHSDHNDHNDHNDPSNRGVGGGNEQETADPEPIVSVETAVAPQPVVPMEPIEETKETDMVTVDEEEEEEEEEAERKREEEVDTQSELQKQQMEIARESGHSAPNSDGMVNQVEDRQNGMASMDKKEDEILERNSMEEEEHREQPDGDHLSDDEYKNGIDEDTHCDLQKDKGDNEMTAESVRSEHSVHSEHSAHSVNGKVKGDGVSSAAVDAVDGKLSGNEVERKEENVSDHEHAEDTVPRMNGVDTANVDQKGAGMGSVEQAVGGGNKGKPADNAADKMSALKQGTVQEGKEKEEDDLMDINAVENGGGDGNGTATVRVSG